MTAYNAASLTGIFHDILDHFVRDRMGKQDNHIRVSDTVAHGSARFAKYFSPAPVFPA